MTDTPQVIRTEHPATADYPHAVIYDVEIDGKSYHLARISYDREINKWWLQAGTWRLSSTHPDLSSAQDAAWKSFPGSVREYLADIAELDVRRDGKFRMREDQEMTWPGWVEFARQILEIDGKYRPHLTGDPS